VSEVLHVVVAGATGVIGRRVVAMLHGQGHRVTGLTRSAAKAPQLAALGAEPAVADAYDADALAGALANAAPDVVIHQLTDLEKADLAANARLRREGTANLVAASRAAGVRRMVAQSIAWAYAPADAALPGPTHGPADESTPLDLTAAEPRATTVEAVATLEEAVSGMPEGVVLRYGMLYGPDTWFQPGGPRAGAAAEGRLAADRAVTSFLHVDDAAAAAVQALGWAPGTYNVVDDEPAMGIQWVPDFCRFLGLSSPEPSQEGAAWASGATSRLARSQNWAPLHPTWRGNWGAGISPGQP
jgi:nucleoside-diphosphate-sugar epimerase